MIDRPILFSAPMVRAILEGRKTQTRRVVKGVDNDNRMRSKKIVTHVMDAHKVGLCPYGQPGDRLWVRETWGMRPVAAGHIDKPSKKFVIYRADGFTSAIPERWRPSIHMPRWASRITLEIVSVRVERLNEISEQDAMAEGIIGPHHLSSEWSCGDSKWFSSTVKAFSNLWESINGADSWAVNPWVWVVEFKRVQP